MRISGRPRALKPWFYRAFPRLWMPRRILPEVFGSDSRLANSDVACANFREQQVPAC